MVAAMTLPDLLNNYKLKETKTQLKKIESLMGQAILMLSAKNEGSLVGICKTDNDHDCFAEALLPYFKYKRFCKSGTEENKNCFGINNVNRPHIILSNGIDLEIFHGKADCVRNPESTSYKSTIEHCASFYVDVNGIKKPNVKGKDVFGFSILSNRVVPFGSPTVFIENSTNTPGTRCERTPTEYCTFYFLQK